MFGFVKIGILNVVVFVRFVRICVRIHDAVTFDCFVRLGVLGSCYISLLCENRYILCYYI